MTGTTTGRESEAPDTTTKIYNFIIEYKCAHDGNSPSYAQVARAVGLRSRKRVIRHLDKLASLGKIKYGRGMIVVTGSRWIPPEGLPPEGPEEEKPAKLCECGQPAVTSKQVRYGVSGRPQATLSLCEDCAAEEEWISDGLGRRRGR